ncbi:hypothetical protein TPAR_03599 [Tolypocladium paradoxum]|uniref:Uncharacterized protein n=1 Tax=Tolypocladium paradoxum TaxID=94208 RepID=A0A2S4L1A7_9HYPO|nr:hypothetical protein TPAR_03599 [Tolypocladium paradoxum]
MSARRRPGPTRSTRSTLSTRARRPPPAPTRHGHARRRQHGTHLRRSVCVARRKEDLRLQHGAFGVGLHVAFSIPAHQSWRQHGPHHARRWRDAGLAGHG